MVGASGEINASEAVLHGMEGGSDGFGGGFPQ
jgi:hypothetical protein